jgi:DNA repair exonuclease SbcCD ATPase subunit
MFESRKKTPAVPAIPARSSPGSAAEIAAEIERIDAEVSEAAAKRATLHEKLRLAGDIEAELAEVESKRSVLKEQLRRATHAEEEAARAREADVHAAEVRDASARLRAATEAENAHAAATFHHLAEASASFSRAHSARSERDAALNDLQRLGEQPQALPKLILPAARDVRAATCNLLGSGWVERSSDPATITAFKRAR